MREDTEYHPWPPFKPVWTYDVPLGLTARYTVAGDDVGEMVAWLRKNTKNRWSHETHEEEVEYYTSDYSNYDYERDSVQVKKVTRIQIHFSNMNDVVVFKTFWM